MPYTAVKSTWSGGNLKFTDNSQNEILTLDGATLGVSGLKSPTPAALTVNTVLTAADSNKVFLVGAADLVITLPSTAAGIRYTFILQNAGLSSGTGLSLSPAALDFVTGIGLTATDNKDLILSGASDRAGDSVTIAADGVDGWYVVAHEGTWAKEA